MEDEKMEDILKTYFSRQRDIPGKTPNCPSIETLGKYVSGELEPDELYNISNHTKGCKFCNELIEGALLHSAYGKQIKLDSVPEKIKNRAKSLNPAYSPKERKKMDFFKKNIWLMFSLITLTLSFFISRYFMQFLILSVIFGLKWIFDRASTRVLIMIYNAWKKHDTTGDREMEEIFKSRL